MTGDMKPSIDIVDGGVVHCCGPWTIPHLVSLQDVMTRIIWPSSPDIKWNVVNISAMDTGGAVLLHRVLSQLRHDGREISVEGLRPEFEELLQVVSSNWSQVSEGLSSPNSYGKRVEQWGKATGHSSYSCPRIFRRMYRNGFGISQTAFTDSRTGL